MLSINIKQIMFSEIPSNLTIDGFSFPIKKTLGSIPLNKLSLPTINIRFIDDGNKYYRSIDDCVSSIDTTTNFVNVNSCILRYTVASTDVIIDAEDSITYKTGTDIYQLQRVPSIDIDSVGAYVKNIDYKLSSDHTSIQWIGSRPANNSIFNVKYKWVDSGYYVASQIAEYLIKDFRGRIFDILKSYGINIIDVHGVKDISDIYVDDSFNAFYFDFVITYPFTWSTTISDEDAITANNFDFDLILNNINIETISYHKDDL